MNTKTKTAITLAFLVSAGCVPRVSNVSQAEENLERTESRFNRLKEERVSLDERIKRQEEALAAARGAVRKEKDDKEKEKEAEALERHRKSQQL